MGKGLTGIRSLQRKRWLDAKGRTNNANLTAGDSEEGQRATTDCWTSKGEKGSFHTLGWNAEASISEEPGAGKPHAGICAGAVG